MKTTNRIATLVLIVIIVLTSCNIFAIAEAVLTMPAALKIIDEEAFYGSTSIDKIALPEGVTEIRSRAFANSSLAEINLPDSLTYIADDAFDGPDKVSVTANPGTIAYDWAVRNQYISTELAIKKVSASVETANIGDVITWTAVVNGGTNEYNYQYTVYNGKSIVMTSSYTSDASFSYSPTAEGQYSVRVTVDDGEDSVSKKTDTAVTVSKAALKIDSIDVSTDEAIIGDIVYWTVKTSGGEAGITYSYVLKKDGIQVDAVSESRSNFYSSILEENGVYILSVTVKDRANATVSSTASALTVGVKPVQVYSIELQNRLPVAQGENLTWNVIAGEGTEPYTYFYTIIIDGEESEAIVTSNSSYTYNDTNAGSVYALKVICRDANGIESEKIGEGVLVYGVEAVQIAAPTIKINADTVVSQTEESATEIEVKDIALAWDQVENAEKYNITLEIAIDGGWQIIWQEETSKLSTVIPRNAWGNITNRTLYRITSVSVALRESAQAYCYLAVSPENYAITIDGKASARWDRTLKSAGERSFVISSPLPWRIASSPDWISVSIVNDTLYLRMSQNVQSSGTRSGEIIVENDKASATITVNQQTAISAPILSYFEDALSTDPEHPTEIPAGSFSLNIDRQLASNSFLRFYEKNNNGQYVYTNWWLRTGKNYCTLPNPYGPLVFNAGKDFCIEISGHFSSEQAKYSEYELPEDIPTQKYYLHMINDGHYVTLNGMTELLIKEYTSSSIINLHASNTVTISSDADWLTYTLSEKATTTGKGYTLKAFSSDNYTGASRTGHLTVICEDEQALLTYVQPDFVPNAITPANLSSTETSPTIYKGNSLSIAAVCAAYNWSVLQNGEYETINASENNDFDENTLSFTDLTVGALYRLTLANGNHETATYYIKKASPDSYIFLSKDVINLSYNSLSSTLKIDTSEKWSISSDATWCTLSESSGSTAASSKKITITTTENTSTNSRIATITAKLTSTGETATCIVEQEGKPAQDAISVYIKSGKIPSGYTIDHFTGDASSLSSYKIMVYCTDPNYAVTSQADWITVSKASYASAVSPTIKCGENNTGSSRTGRVVFTSGTAQFVLNISQDSKLENPQILEPAFSQDRNNPSIYQYDDGNLTVKWNAISNAKYYYLWLINRANSNIICELQVEDAGQSTYYAIIPQAYFDWDSDNGFSIEVVAINEYGHYSTSEDQYFKVQLSDAAYLNGSLTPQWINVSDFGDVKTFTVSSTSNWTATSNNSWLSLNTTSGASGDQLIVTATENNGAKRTGTVTVSVNGNATLLTVEQNAYISQTRPEIVSPMLSDDMGNPTILSSVPSTFTVKWNAVPGMNYYRVVLREVGTGRLDESGRLDEGENQYTFDINPSSDIRKGYLYSISIVSSCDRWGVMDRLYYFMLADDTASLNLGWYENGPVELWSDRDYADNKITSSGYWTAKANVDWIYLDDEYVEKEDSDNPGEMDYQSFYGNSGDFLTITAAANPGETRIGYITVSCGGISKTITVKQLGTYQRAEFTENYSTDSANPTEIKQSSLALNWSQGETNSSYWIELYERRENSTFQYDRVYQKTTENRYLTIPQSYLEQGKHYKVYLTTILNGNDKNDSSNPVQIVYLYVGYDNALTLSATVDWSQNYVGGTVSIQANASGGSGEYLYIYRLLRDGQVVGESNDITGMTKQNWYSFTLEQVGNYQAEVTVYDKNTAKTVTRTYTATEAVTEGQKAEISIDQTNWAPDAVGASMTVDVSANMDWTCRGSDSWITVTKKSNTQGYVTVTANNTNSNRTGRAIFNIGSVGVSMEIVQEPVSAPQDSTLKLTPAVWSVAGYSAEQTSVFVSSSGDWTIASYPDWVIPSATSGARGDRVSFYAKPNDKEEPRQAEVFFACGNVTKAFTVMQSALDLQPHIDSVDFSETTVPTGKNVTMAVKVRNAVEVQLWVDGNLLTENTVTVLGNAATVVRAFSMAGERKIQLRAVREDGVGVFSEEYNISVTSNGALDAPVVAALSNTFVGTDVDIHWSTSNNATNYTLILLLNGSEITRWSTIVGTSQLIEGKYLTKAGSYIVLVLATAEGYSQSEGSALLHVIEPVEDFEITFPTNGAPFETHDQIIYKISNPSQKYIRIKITKGTDTWYLPENGVTNAVSPEFTFIPVTAGTYNSCILSYIDDMAIGSDSHWNKNPQITTYTVSAGTIDSVSVGSNEKNQARQSVGGMTIRGKMGMQTITITESGVASPIAILNAENHSTIDSRNYRRVFHYKPTSITEGYHVYSFTSVDADNVTSTKTFDLFAYTGYESPFVRYPANKQVHLLAKPTDSASSGEILLLSDKLNVLGHYGNNLYYVQLDKNAEKYGYVLINQTSEKEVIDWSTYDLVFISWSSFGDSDVFPLTTSPYQITVNWSLNKPLPEGAGYSVSLIDEDGKYYVISPNEPLKGSSYTFSSARLETILGNNSEVEIGVQISLYDIATGNNLLQCSSPDNDERFIGSQVFEESAKEWVKLGMQACILYHDNTYRCAYQIGNKIYYADRLTTMAYAADRITMLYSFGTGDGSATTLTKEKRAMLLASSIMNNVASDKASNPVDLESLKTLLSICGFGADYVIAFEESIVDSFGDISQINMDYAPQKLQNALGELSAAKDLKAVVKTASTTAEVIKMITGVLTDYSNFSKVTRNDVQVFIDAFKQSSDSTLQATATNLECMTAGSLSLGGYLGAVYGFDYAEKFVTKQFPDIIALIPGMKGYKLVASGVKLGADLSMNTSKVFKARHELLAISAQVDKIRDDFVDSFNRFYNEPLTYYDEFVQAKELLLKMLPLEFEKYNAVVSALNDGKVNKAVYAIGEHLANWPKDRTIHTEDYIEWIRSYIDPALNYYYSQYIERFR